MKKDVRGIRVMLSGVLIAFVAVVIVRAGVGLIDESFGADVVAFQDHFAVATTAENVTSEIVHQNRLARSDRGTR